MFLLDAKFETATNATAYTNEILIDIAIKTYLTRALSYVSKDRVNQTVRPALCGVCIEFYPNNTLKIIATDAHRLYVSPAVNYSGPSIETGKQIIIPLDACKQIAAVKPASKTANVSTLKFNDTDFCMSGITGKLTDHRYPSYLEVIPKNQPYLFTIDKNQLLTGIKTALPFTNKTTHQVNFSINDNLKIAAQDIDFSYEAGQSMDYINSNVPDCNFSFNGKLLTDILKAMPGDNVTFFTDGITQKDAKHVTRQFIIRGANTDETALLMPLMMHV